MSKHNPNFPPDYEPQDSLEDYEEEQAYHRAEGQRRASAFLNQQAMLTKVAEARAIEQAKQLNLF